MATDVLSADGRVVHFPPAAVAACATLAHVTQHCPAGSVPVPFAADTLECFLAALGGGDAPEERSAVPEDVAAELVVVADYLDCAALMQPLCRRLAGSDLTGRDFSLELWSCIVEHIELPAGCALALQRPELTDVLRPRLVALAKRVTLRSAASNGHLAVCQWLTEEFGITRGEARAWDNSALRFAAIHGHLGVCQWLTEKFGLTADDVRATYNQVFHNQNMCCVNGRRTWRTANILRAACGSGQVAVCQWLTERFGLTVDDVRANDNDALRFAVINGHLEVCQWLTEKFGLTADDVRGTNAKYPAIHVLSRADDMPMWSTAHALCTAAITGHLAVCQWLTEKFGLTAADARANSNLAFRWAAEEGRLEVCQWLTETFHLTAADACANGNDAFRRAAGEGHLEVCQWLTEKFGLTAADARANGNLAFRWAAGEGHLAVCQWMVERFGLTADDASCAIRRCLPLCNSNDDQRAVVEWLVGRFGLETPEENRVIVNASTYNFLWYSA
jgi:hypothetical protein